MSKTRKNEKYKKSVFFLFFALFLFSCEGDPEFMQKIDEEIAWSNAAKLTVTVVQGAGNEAWGSSPQNGEGSRDNKRQNEKPRKGYPFNVEFTPNSDFGFVEWLAFESETYTEKAAGLFFALSSGVDYEDAVTEFALNRTSVETLPKELTHTGAWIQTITINESIDVTLLPYSDTRPRIVQTNPPLVNTGVSYNLGQTITIYFSEPGLNYQTGELSDFFAEGLIQIIGQTISGNKFYDDLSEFFSTPSYNDNLRTITIRPEDLPLEELIITVTVGPNIESKNGNIMSSPVSFSWITNTETIRDRFTAENIWGIHNPDTAASEANFFYLRAMPNIASNYRDARLRKNALGNYEITLYFSITANNDEMGEPTHCVIQEYRAFSLTGNNTANVGETKTYSITPITTNIDDPAANTYRTANDNVRAYRITHELQTGEAPMGIWRLVLTPYRHQGSDRIGLDTWGNAHTQGCYSTVVLNETLPAGNAVLSLNTTVSGTGIYNYGANNQLLNFDVNFNNVVDTWTNSGILRDRADTERPWTIDLFNEIEWQWRIVGSNGIVVHSPNVWLSTDTRSITDVNLKDVLGSSLDIRRIELRYRNKLNQESNWIETSSRLIYFEANYGNVSAYSAIYDPDADTITVNWTNPVGSDFDRVEVWYRVNDMNIVIPPVFDSTSTAYNPKANGFIISSVPRLVTSGVWDGIPVSNTHQYEIFMRTHSVVDSREAVSFKIWNFGTPDVENSGMRTGTAPEYTEAIEVNEQLTVSSEQLGKTFVLTRDIVITNHVPIGDSDFPFTGSFYGNGHKVTINSWSWAPPENIDDVATVTDIGLFGVTGGNALISDVTVEYETAKRTAVTISTNENAQFGGIAGTTTGSTQLINVLVKGSVNYNIQSDYSAMVGGLVGQMIDTSSIKNAYGELNLTVNKFTNSTQVQGIYTYIGGIAGSMGGINGAAVTIEGVNSVGNITVGSARNFNTGWSSRTLGLFIGGLAGQAHGADNTDVQRVKIHNSGYQQGSIIVMDGNGSAAIGGAVGKVIEYANISNCFAKPTVININKNNTVGSMTIGGFIGFLEANGTIINCYSEGPITIPSTAGSGYAGGFAGRLDADISYCFAKGNVSVGILRNIVAAGGFVGELSANASFCYATGDVIATRLYVASIVNLIGRPLGHTVGGFAGSIMETASISNSYALGNVFAYDAFSTGFFYTGIIAAGGFVGWFNSTGNINRCFSRGNVNAHRTGGGSPIFAGGLIGRAGDNTDTVNINIGRDVHNSVAFGSSVIITVGGSISEDLRNIGRIYGSARTDENKLNNRAFSGMSLFSDTRFDPRDPVRVDVPENPLATSQHGADTGDNLLRSRAFWENATTGLGFSNDDWDFTLVTTQRYPFLRASKNGSRMGGQ
ncbi:MAG: hypothetical protein FWD26_03845 [Treponema sp.]|nr:hypothetical protein [Treponema sp.]